MRAISFAAVFAILCACLNGIHAYREDVLSMTQNDLRKIIDLLAEDGNHASPTNDYKFGTLIENFYIRLHRYLFKKGKLPVSEWGREIWNEERGKLYSENNWTNAPVLPRESINRFWEAEKHNVPRNARCLEHWPAFYINRHPNCKESWVVDYEPNKRKARVDATTKTIHDDLADFSNTPEFNTFDTIVATQVLELPSNPYRVAKTWFKLLKPGGVLFTTQPFVERDVRRLTGWPDHFRFTDLGMEALLHHAGFEVETVYFGGNNMLTTAFLMGFSVHDFSEDELKATLIKKGSAQQEDIYYSTLVIARKPTS